MPVNRIEEDAAPSPLVASWRPATVDTRRHEKVREALERWYRGKLGFDQAQLIEFRTPGTGAVNDTFLHRVEWATALGTKTLPFVLRPQPMGETPIPDVDVSAQAMTLKALSAVPSIPTPRLLWMEQDPAWLGQSFYIMEMMKGEPVFDVGPGPADPAALRMMFHWAMDLVADIHAVDWRANGFQHLLDGAAVDGGLLGQVEAYARHLERSAGGKPYPQLEAALRWLLDNLPADRPSVLNWGDARVGNLLFIGTDVSAVLDWEMAHIAPREVDVGWFTFLERFFWTDGLKCRPGGPTAAQMVARYEARAGVQLRDLDWFERWAAFRLAVMRMRAGRQMIARGEQPAASRIDEVNPAALQMADIFGFAPP